MQTGPDAAAETSSPGRLIRSKREAAGLSRDKLAYESQVSPSTVARLELYDQLPATLALARIAARLEISLTDLLPVELRVPATAAAASP